MAARREIKVGVFVLAGFVALGSVIFALGEEPPPFQPKREYQVAFRDVQGLRPGSPVRLGGVDIGKVTKVAYGADEKDARIFVTVAVLSDHSKRIRKDSVATIESKGLLGDKMIAITVGSNTAQDLPPGSSIESRESDDLARMMTKVRSISVTVETVDGANGTPSARP